MGSIRVATAVPIFVPHNEGESDPRGHEEQGNDQHLLVVLLIVSNQGEHGGLDDHCYDGSSAGTERSTGRQCVV